MVIVSWPAGLHAGDQQRLQIGAGGVDRGGVAGRPGADDQDFAVVLLGHAALLLPEQNRFDRTNIAFFVRRGDRADGWHPDFRSKAEHVVEAERAVAAQETMITKQAAGRVADDRVGPLSGAGAGVGVEQLAIAEQPRPGTRDRQSGARDLAAEAVVQDDFGRADRPPGERGRVDKVAERIVAAVAEPQEQPGREAGRRAAIGLRLAAINQQRIEYMRAEAGLGGVPAGAMAIAEQRVQPAVAVAALGEIVDQLDMPVIAAEFVAEAQRGRMVARQPAEALSRRPRVPSRS